MASPKSAPLIDGTHFSEPAWFSSAIAWGPERSTVEVAGARIEVLTWGTMGKPGILFVHGKGAHADWWSFIAPSFAQNYRVVALSLSGMGGSGWRDDYPVELLAQEVRSALHHGGALSCAVPPVIVAHSFGSVVTASFVRSLQPRPAAIVLVDPPYFSAEKVQRRREGWNSDAPKPHRIYATRDEALKRFRFSPYQETDNLFIVDYIARRSLVQVNDIAGRGWRWRFDPRHWAPDRQQAITDLSDIDVPLSVILGADSTLRDADDLDYMRSNYPPGTVEVVIPEAAHHVMIDQPIAFVARLDALLPRSRAPRTDVREGSPDIIQRDISTEKNTMSDALRNETHEKSHTR